MASNRYDTGGGGVSFPSWTLLSGVTFAEMDLTDNFVTGLTEASDGRYQLAIDYVGWRTNAELADKMQLSETTDTNLFTVWAAKSDPDAWALQLRLEITTGYDDLTWKPYVALYVQNSDASGLLNVLGVVCIDGGSGTWDTNALTTTSSLGTPGGHVATDEIILTILISDTEAAAKRGALHYEIWSAGAIVRRSSVISTADATTSGLSIDVLAELEIWAAFNNQATGGSGTSSADADFTFSGRIIQIRDER